ncbi:MarR family winged helix-turn-helix transcriptional regulator [Saccharicrinis fermentans]|uniref:Multiple antibiotic resistance protein MarR n=1 Tax=Saccharicrinis fermentans DSM 9555 = JCM 21142 TaxID=869213 RepID=W7XV08_9BACT|nr:MarR family transcriptional regulator [Saccharicrinis fermentans]GAF01900.1 multiple antibiotic resistance protein MarR [Saccharicrinis fermentans DSM 9555 = JCM 21142]
MKIEEEIKGRFRNEYHKGAINLGYTFKQIEYAFNQSLKAHGLAEQQYNVLRILRGFRAEAPLSIGFIKERMLDKNSDVSRIVDRLLKKRLVSRIENPNDRRQKSVEITKKGLELLDNMLNYELKVDTLLKNLSQNEVEELNRLLDKIRE